MATRAVLTGLRNERLRTRAHKVRHCDASITRLVRDLAETMAGHGAAGLAAPQIGVPLRVFVLREWLPGGEVGTQRALPFINPEIVEYLDDGPQPVAPQIEGCLSLPGGRYKVARSGRIRVRAQTPDGQRRSVILEGALAAAFQHELDHLDGILCADREASLLKRLAQRAQTAAAEVLPDKAAAVAGVGVGTVAAGAAAAAAVLAGLGRE